MSREWRDIRGYEGRYQVSDDGYVRSLPDIDPRGRFVGGVVLRAAQSEKGYLRVSIADKTFKVHRLVAEAFIPNTQGLPQINHKNGVKSDNRRGNLEWCNNSMNQTHRHRVLGQASAMTGRTGALCKNSKPVRARSVADGATYEFAGASEAARVLGVGQSGISLAARGELRSYKGYIWEYK